ncbi:unnamed protein product [Adineta steineri]|uniref:G-protein coupled receptors family 1 profile domain-containing protein n=1 Tax=Adineta steineri TaxID=433720 RepID=A0A819CV51_9BILA|nr:unnamed protein product [Adineta steineri]
MNDSLNNFIYNEWTQPALASCQILKWIGGYLCFAFICGITLNGIILSILCDSKHRRSPIDIFIICLCISDLLASLLGIPLPLTSNLACRWLYGKYLCYYEGFIAYFVGMVGLYLLTALSLNRYWIIVTPNREEFVTFKTAYISVFLSILGGLFWAVPPILGWNDYTLEGARTSCSIRWQDRTVNVISYNILMFVFAYIVPLSVMIYCNICIYLKVRQVAKNKLLWNKSSTILRSHQKRQNVEQRLAKTVFIIILTFSIAWTPYAFVAFISSFFSPTIISPLGASIPAIFAKSSVYFNPFVYIMSNSHIRSKLFHWRKTINRTQSDPSKETFELTTPLNKCRTPLTS